jgi:hypothetical protein
MCGIGQQRDRMGGQAEHYFSADKSCVDRRSNGKGAVKSGGWRRVVMVMAANAMIMVMLGFVVLVLFHHLPQGLPHVM